MPRRSSKRLSAVPATGSVVDEASPADRLPVGSEAPAADRLEAVAQYPGPRLPSFLVDRPRLTDLLESGSPLTILRSPLGFGKTTLVAQWLQGRSPAPGQAVWMRVTDDSAGGDDFWAALMRAFPSADLDVQERSGEPRPRVQVRRALAAAGGPMILVIDEFQRVTDDAVDRDLLEMLQDTPGMRLVACLRSARHFRPMHLLDIDSTIVEAGDLRFTTEETVRLLHGAGADASWELGVKIRDETGGWPEPTRAVVLKLRDADGEPGAEIAAQVAADYMRDQVLPAASRVELMEFALSTSLFDPIPIGLAEALAGDHGSSAADWLEVLEQEGMLLSVFEGEERVFRWPPLVRRALTDELARRDPGRAETLNHTAARWYLKHDAPVSALDHARSAQKWELVVEIIESQWMNVWARRPAVLTQTLAEMPAPLIDASPLARAVQGLRLEVPGDVWLAGVRSLPADAEELARVGQSPDAGRTIDIGMATLIGFRARGKFAQAAAYAKRLEAVGVAATRAQSTEGLATMPSLLLELGKTRMLADQMKSARRPLRHAYELGAGVGAVQVMSDTSGKLAMIAALAGERGDTEIWLERHGVSPHLTGWQGNPTKLAALAAQAIGALEQLDMATARAALDRARTFTANVDEFWAFHMYAEALYALHDRRPSVARSTLEETRSQYAQLARPGSTAWALLTSMEIDLLLSHGRANMAAAILKRVTTKHPMIQVSQARLALLSGDLDQAVSLTNSHSWTHLGTARLVTELLLIRSVADHRRGHHKGALISLRNAIATAMPTRAIRAFTTVPKADLGEIAPRLDDEHARFLTDPVLEAASRPFPSVVRLIELTAREQTMLEKLVNGALIQDIGAELFLSRNTVKTHVRNLYRKLGVSSREEARAQAESLGLL
jgi:LuxR family maltose regulon positive regulatory protein